MESSFLGVPLIEWFGYTASVIVAFSLVMSSIVKLRWYNLLGAGFFSIYGFMIGALPVGFLNGFIALADIYYLIQIYKKEEYFEIMNLDNDSQYLKYFLNYQKDDIKKIFPGFKFEEATNGTGFYLLRDITPVGMIFGEKDGNTYNIKLDYILPQYRDFKMGKYVFKDHIDIFEDMEVEKLITKPQTQEHNTYLEKMGFKLKKDSDGKQKYIKQI